ncbi:MAG: beta-propeller domain-containing protein [bacterium]
MLCKKTTLFSIIIFNCFLIFNALMMRSSMAQIQTYSMPSSVQWNLSNPYVTSTVTPFTGSWYTSGLTPPSASSVTWDSWTKTSAPISTLFGGSIMPTYSWWWHVPVSPIVPLPWVPVSQKKLDYKVATDKFSYSEGEPVKITFNVTNKMATPLTLNFSSGKQFDIVIKNNLLKVIWQLSSHQYYTMALTTLTLAPFETKSFQAQWEQEDNNGVSVAPGDYTIEAFLTPTAIGYQEVAQARITIKSMIIDESYNNKTVYLKKDGTIRIELAANPSTGYKWFADWDTSKLSLTSYMYMSPNMALVGMGGRDVWIFKAVGLGTTSISFTYKRQWETNVPPLKTMTFTIVIASNITELRGKQSAFVSADTDAQYAGAYGGYAYGAMAPGEVARETADQVAREIEEADIIKIEGTYLYLLNSYRGLIICDISDPRFPVILSKTPLESVGTPIDMYIRDERAYIIVNYINTDPYYSTDIFKIQPQEDAFIPTTAPILSRVIVMNIGDKSTPSVISSFDVEGSVTDSRIVGTILYVVASEYAYYYGPYGPYVRGFVEEPVAVTVPLLVEDSGVSAGGDVPSAVPINTEEAVSTVSPDIIAPDYIPPEEPQQQISILSIDISDPLNIREVDRINFEGFTNNIHVTDKAIFVESTQYNHPDTNTEVTYADINDPKGLINVRGSILVRGSVEDKFKMDFYNGYFRICTYEWTEKGGISNLYVIDFTEPDTPHLISSLMLGEGEQLFATRFDGEHAYMVTFERIDPLWVIDLGDPYNPQVKGELEVSGWSTHIEPRGDRLVTLGVDDTAGRMVSVSLFDVSDPGNPLLMKRVSFGDKEGWSTSGAYGDVKAFTILDEIGLILLPYSTYTYSEGTSYYDNRLQLIDYTDNDLKARGWVSQKGSVLRSRSVEDYLFSVSSEEIQVISAEDRDNPRIVASATLALNIIDAIPLSNGYVVRLIGESSGGYMLSAVPLSDPEDGPVVSELKLDSQNMPTITGNGNLVYMLIPHVESFSEPISEPVTVSTEEPVIVKPQEIYRTVESTTIRIIDFTNVTKPRERGSLEIPGFYQDIRPLEGSLPVSSYIRYNVVQMKKDVFVFNKAQPYYYPYLYAEVEQGDTEQKEFSGFIVVDLSQPDKPGITAEVPFDEAPPRTCFAKNGMFYFSYSQSIGEDEQKRPRSQYYLSRINLSNPSQPIEQKKINIPGYCVGVDDTGDFVYTIDSTWSSEKDDPYLQDYTFNVVKIVGDTAYLFDTVELEGTSSYTAIIDGRYAYLAGAGYFRYYGGPVLYDVRVSSSYPYYYGGKNEFMIIDLSNPEKLVPYTHSMEGISVDMLGAKGGKIFINSNGGVGCYSVTNPQQPILDAFTPGYSWKIVFNTDKGFVSLGYSGLWVKSL